MITAKIWILFSLVLPIISLERQISCDSHLFSCSDGSKCIRKNYWCDSGCDCEDCSDERYCNKDSHSRDLRCSGDEFFPCNVGECIPIEGRCDGFSSCVDSSDEEECGCEELLEEFKTTSFKAMVGKIYNKCWKVIVPHNKFLVLEFTELDLTGDCRDIQISIKSKKSTVEEELFAICFRNQTSGFKRIETFDDTEITFSSSKIINNRPEFHSFTFQYKIADILCKRSDVFKCTHTSCISPEKKCDDVQDCENGLDELHCERGVFIVQGVHGSRMLGLKWLMNQRNAAWGWRENTHRAIVAIYLANGANFNGTNKEEDLTAKQLELQMSTAILRNGTNFITPTQLSMYVNALLIICHDPRNFYGYNLIKELKKQATKTFHPSLYLALFNAKELPSQSDVDKLFSMLEVSSGHSFITDIQAVATTALSYVIKDIKFSHLTENVTRVTKRFKEQQLDDGSFGNIYTTALVVQALLASEEEEAKDWNLKGAIEFLKQKQNKVDGSFGDFLATYLILPILNRKSLADIGRVTCSENLKMPRDGNPVSDIELKLGAKISVHYFLYIGEQKDQEHPIYLRVPENITVLEMMRLAAEADPKYRFEHEDSKGKSYIYEVSGIVNDPEDGKFWLLYTGTSKESIQIETRSPGEIIVYGNEHVVMWYKSVEFL